MQVRQIYTQEHGWMNIRPCPISQEKLADLRLAHKASHVNLAVTLRNGEEHYPDYRIDELIE